MKKSVSPRKGYGKTVIIIAGVVLFLLFAVTGAEMWLGHKIRSVIENEQPGIAGERSRGAVGKVRVSLPGRTVKLKNISLTSEVRSAADGISADTAGSFADNVESGPTDISVRELVVAGIGFKKKNGKYAIKIRRLELNTPVARLNGRNARGAAADTAKTKPLDNKITDVIGSLAVDRIIVGNGRVKYLHSSKSGGLTSYASDGFNLDIQRFRIDSLTDKNFFSHAGLKFFLSNFECRMEKTKMLATVDSLEIDSERGYVSAASINLLPGVPKYEYAENVEGHPDWSQYKVGKTTFYGIDFDRLFTGRELYADSVTVAEADVQSYKNRHVEQAPSVKGLFWRNIQKLPVKIDVPVVSVSNIDATYEEFSIGGISPGVVTIDDINARFTGITNIVKEENQYFTMKATAKLYEKAPIDVTLRFPVDSLNDRFVVDGTIGRMELSGLNRMIEPLSHIEVKTGVMSGLSFHVEGNSFKADITSQFLYDGLSVVLVRDKPNGPPSERKFLTSLVQGFLLKKSNPDGNGKVREGLGSFERDPYRSQFNYLWKTIFQGVKDTVMAI